MERLAIEVISLAVKDAIRGSGEAREWLTSPDATLWLEVVGFAPEAVRRGLADLDCKAKQTEAAESKGKQKKAEKDRKRQKKTDIPGTSGTVHRFKIRRCCLQKLNTRRLRGFPPTFTKGGSPIYSGRVELLFLGSLTRGRGGAKSLSEGE